MIISKKAIPRRTVLRGLGATMSLPLLDGMVPAMTGAGADAGAAGAPLRRGLRAERDGHGELPPGDARAPGFELTPTLQGMAPFREQMLVLSGLDCVPTPGPARRRARQGVHALPDRHLAADQRDVARRRHLGRSDPGQRAGQADAARVAGAGHRVERHGGRLRRRLRLRLHQHDFVAQREHAAADAAQPARGVRAAVRRQRQHRRARPAGAAAAASAACSTR